MKTTIRLLIFLGACYVNLAQTPKIINLEHAAHLKKTVGIKTDFIAINGNYAWVVDDYQKPAFQSRGFG